VSEGSLERWMLNALSPKRLELLRAVHDSPARSVRGFGSADDSEMATAIANSLNR
jgi:predicted transcriptional regulator